MNGKSRDDDLARTFADICVLYELSLAIGTSLDLQENCRVFLDALGSRKGFSYSAVWIRRSRLPGGAREESEGFELVYAAPHVLTGLERLPLDHAIPRALEERGAFSASHEEPGFADLVTEADVTQGVYAVFPLGDLGFLKTYSRARSEVLSPQDLSQLETLARKFAGSLHGCLAHEMLRSEVAERERVEAEREAIRMRLQHGQKMEAVGRLAGGIAHDFNNLLVGVLGTVELLQLEEGLSKDLQADLDIIASAGQRGAELTRQLLSFARTNEEETAPVDLDGLVQEVVALLRRTLDASIEIRMDLRLGDLRVNGVASRLHTMLINLAVNARDAMLDGGVLSLETSEIDPPTPGRRAVEPARWVELVVRDSGVGMPAAVAERAFEPFYSTKAVGKGTGLGLATVYGIVRSHSGHVSIDSAPGKGTAFVIRLPAGEPALATRPAPEVPASRSRRDGLVLVVDDRADTRTTGRRMLERLGYRVIEAADGRQALRSVAELGTELSAVLLDVQMPVMNGVEALMHIRANRPDLPVVMVSGFAQPEQVVALAELGAEEILSKPYRLEELSAAIEKAEATIGAPFKDSSRI